MPLAALCASKAFCGRVSFDFSPTEFLQSLWQQLPQCPLILPFFSVELPLISTCAQLPLSLSDDTSFDSTLPYSGWNFFYVLMGQRWFKDDLSSQLLIGRSKFEVESAPRLKLSQYHGTQSWLSPIDSLDSWQSICKLKLEVFFVKQTLFVNALHCHFPLIRFYEIVHDYSFSKWNWGLDLRLTSS